MMTSTTPADALDMPVHTDISLDAPGVRELARIAMDAWRSIPPPQLLFSILGRPSSWISPRNRYSEYRIVDVWRMRRTIRFLVNVSIPSVPRTPPTFSPPMFDRLFWQPTVILQRPDHTGSYTSFPDESWFFVNGVATNDAVAQVNSAYLSYLFHRPLTMIQNSTDSLPLDLIECMFGKEWYRYTEAATKAFPPIYDALRRQEKRRVVVIAHSQGTIIMATILKMLAAVALGAREAAELELPAAAAYAPPEFVYPDQYRWRVEDFDPLTAAELAKLEVYCFANCANKMKYIYDRGPESIPWIENYANEFDLVARLGMLAPRQAERSIEIDGASYMKPNGWGHLLNAHYLGDIEKMQKQGYKRGGTETPAPYVALHSRSDGGHEIPRLFGYINGGTPAAAD